MRDWVPESALLSSADLKSVTVVRGDVCDGSLLARALCEYEIETVFHLAAQAIVGTARANPKSTFEINVGGTVNLLEAARQAPRVKQVLIASSDKAYGAHDALPYNEDTPLARSASLRLLQNLRRFNRAKLRMDVWFASRHHALWQLIWRRRFELESSHSRHDSQRHRRHRADHSQRRKIHARLSLRRRWRERLCSLWPKPWPAEKAKPGEAFNFGHNQPVTVLEVVQKILEAGGRPDLQPEILGQASDEIRKQYLDSSRAYETLGWHPQYSFEEGLTRTLDWYRNFLKEE